MRLPNLGLHNREPRCTSYLSKFAQPQCVITDLTQQRSFQTSVPLGLPDSVFISLREGRNCVYLFPGLVRSTQQHT